MTQLKFKITHYQFTHEVYINRDVSHTFKSKRQATDYIRKYKKTVHDNVVILNNLEGQLNTVVKVFYTLFNHEAKYKWTEFNSDFAKAHYQIYHNMGGANGSTVQFNKILLCFNYLEDQMNFLKKYGQRHKLAGLLTQLEAQYKILNVVWDSYEHDIKFLMSPSTFKPVIRTLNATDESIKPLRNRKL